MKITIQVELTSEIVEQLSPSEIKAALLQYISNDKTVSEYPVPEKEKVSEIASKEPKFENKVLTDNLSRKQVLFDDIFYKIVERNKNGEKLNKLCAEYNIKYDTAWHRFQKEKIAINKDTSTLFKKKV